MRESGLAEQPDYVRVLQFKDVSALGWNTLIQQAGAEAKRLRFDALVVDTFAVFAGLKGSEENDSGPVADRMRVLRLVAQKYGIAVLLIRHAGKDGTPRGSSAFEAEADICVSLSRPEGRHAPTVRKITGIGRYGEWERNIQLKDGRFVSLGADDKIEFNKAVGFIRAVLPTAPDSNMKKQDILDKRGDADADISASTLDCALAWLVKKGDVGEKQLTDQRGKPKVYWLAYKPPGGGGQGDGGEFIYSHQTPSPNGENKPKPAGELGRSGPFLTSEGLKNTREAKNPENDPNGPNGPNGPNPEPEVHPKPEGGNGRRLTEDEARKVQRLTSQGMKPEIARREVLGVEA